MKQDQQNSISLPAIISSDSNPLELGRAPFWPLRYCERLSFLRNVPKIFWLTDTCKPNFVVELGVDHAQCYFSFCQAMERVNPNGVCFGVSQEVLSEEISSHNTQHYKDFSSLSSGSLGDGLRDCANGAIDILALNGGLGKDELRELSKFWGQKLSERAIIVVRNYNGNDSESLDVILQSFGPETPRILFDSEEEHDEGMMVLLHGPVQPKSLVKIASLEVGKPDLDIFRSVFDRLGESAYYRGQSENLKNALVKQRRALAAAPTAKDLETLRAAYRARSGKLGKLQVELAATMSELHHTKKQLSDVRDHYASISSSCENEINRLCSENGRLLAESGRARHRHQHETMILTRKLEDENSDLRFQVKKSQEDFDRVNVLLKLKNAFVSQVHSRFRRIFHRRSRSRENVRAARIVAASPYFDANWYLKEYPDVSASRQDPALHFVLHGIYEGRRPSEDFDPIAYYISHPDALDASVNPLVHLASNHFE